jgi:hypothetical protein
MAFVTLFGIKMTYLAFEVLIGEALVGVTILTALIMAHTHRGRYHHWLILGAFLGDLLVVKPIMIMRISQGVFGPFPFSHTLGLPHMALAIGTASLGVAAILLGFHYRVKSVKSKKMYMTAGGRIHGFVGAAFVAVWVITLIYGLRIFFLFYGFPK